MLISQNISTNLGGFLSPLIVGYLAKHFGWQWGLMAPGMFGLAAGMVLLFALADKPEDTGAWLPFYCSGVEKCEHHRHLLCGCACAAPLADKPGDTGVLLRCKKRVVSDFHSLAAGTLLLLLLALEDKSEDTSVCGLPMVCLSWL
jgi:MFS family permease